MKGEAIVEDVRKGKGKSREVDDQQTHEINTTSKSPKDVVKMDLKPFHKLDKFLQKNIQSRK